MSESCSRMNELWHFMTHKNLPWDSQGNTEMVLERATVVDLELTWQHLLSEVCAKQMRFVCVNQFHLSQ